MLEIIISLLLAEIAPEDQVEPLPTGRTAGPWVELVDVSGIGATTYWARLDYTDEDEDGNEIEGVVSVVSPNARPTVNDLESELSD